MTSQSSREEQALAHLMRFPGASHGDIQVALGLTSRSQAQRIVTRLQRRGQIKRSGERLPHSRVRSLEAVRGHQ